MKLMHIVDLESLAGIEILFKDLYKYLGEKKTTEQAVMLPVSKIHPLIKQEIAELGELYVAKKIGGCSVPSIPFLRNANYRRILRKEKSDTIVIWNRLKLIGDESPLEIKHIYYEHSTCWYKHDPKRAIDVFSKSSLIIAVSHATKRFLELKYGEVIKCPIKVLYNPLPSSRLQRKERIQSPKIRLGFAGHFIPRKSPWVVIHVLKKLLDQGHQAEAHFAGEGELLEKTKKLAKELNVFNQCFFLGSVKDMPEFFSRVDYLLAPSVSETFGLSPLEAAYHGALPIVTAVDGLVEVYKEFQEVLTVAPVLNKEECEKLGGELPMDIEYVYDPASDSLVKPKAPSPEMMFQKISYLENNKFEKSKVIQFLQEKIEKEFAFEKYADEFYGIVNEKI